MVRQERRIARNPVFIGGRDRDRTCDPYHVKAVESDGIGMFRGLVPRNGPGSFDIGSGESAGFRCGTPIFSYRLTLALALRTALTARRSLASHTRRASAARSARTAWRLGRCLARLVGGLMASATV